MSSVNYVVVVRDSSVTTGDNRKTGLTLAWVQLKKLADNSDVTPQPTITEIGEGQYKLAYDAAALGEASGQIDAGASLNNGSDRYIDVFLTLDSGRILTALPSAAPATTGGLTVVGTAVTLPASVPAGYATSANQASILTATNAITTNTARGKAAVPTFLARPSAGSTTYEVDLSLYSLQGQSEAPDAAPTVHARDASGNSRDAALGSTTMSLIATGRYKVTFAVASTDATGEVFFDFAWAVGGVAFSLSDATIVEDAESLSTLAAIQAQTDKLAFDGSGNLKSAPQVAVTVGAYAAGLDPLSLVVAGGVKLAVDGSGRVGANNLPSDYQQRGAAVTLPSPAPAGYGGAAAADVVTALGQQALTFRDQTSVASPTVMDAWASAWVDCSGDEQVNASTSPPTYVKKSPAGAVFRTFTLDAATAPTSRT